jgi:hypothetical protein
MKINKLLATLVSFIFCVATPMSSDGKERQYIWVLMLGKGNDSEIFWDIIKFHNRLNSEILIRDNENMHALSSKLFDLVSLEADLPMFFETPDLNNENRNDSSFLKLPKLQEVEHILESVCDEAAQTSGRPVILSPVASMSSRMDPTEFNHLRDSGGIVIKHRDFDVISRIVEISKRIVALTDLNSMDTLSIYKEKEMGESLSRWHQYLEGRGHQLVKVSWLSECGAIAIRSIPPSAQSFGTGENIEYSLASDVGAVLSAPPP